MTVGPIFTKNIYLYIFILGFFRKPEKLGSHTRSKWWPGDQDVKDDPNDPLTRWPNDPVACLVHGPTCMFNLAEELETIGTDNPAGQ